MPTSYRKNKKKNFTKLQSKSQTKKTKPLSCAKTTTKTSEYLTPLAAGWFNVCRYDRGGAQVDEAPRARATVGCRYDHKTREPSAASEATMGIIVEGWGSNCTIGLGHVPAN